MEQSIKGVTTTQVEQLDQVNDNRTSTLDSNAVTVVADQESVTATTKENNKKENESNNRYENGTLTVPDETVKNDITKNEMNGDTHNNNNNGPQINDDNNNDDDDAKTNDSKSVDLASRSTESNFGSFDLNEDIVNEAILEANNNNDNDNNSNPTTSTAIPSTAVGNMSSSATDNTKSVTPQRKEELLLQARADRIKWIQNVPLPYEIKHKENDRLSTFLQYSHATQILPSASAIIQQLLYEDNSINEQQMSTTLLLNNNDDYNNEEILLTGNQILEAEIAKSSDNTDKFHLLTSYQTFINILQDPACGTSVQGMRNFCRNFQNNNNNKDEAINKLKSYITATTTTLSRNNAFKNFVNNDNNQLLPYFIETFIYGQCRKHIENLFLTNELIQKDIEFEEKLQNLQFITSEHLEISCLTNNNNKQNKSSADNIYDILSGPIECLEGVDTYHSIYGKLQQILNMYRCINITLTKALNEGNNNSGKEKLPSADDVLPTIILTVLKTNKTPKRLFYNLQLIEELSPPEYLRGEAGYAYTNLYGAVQFIQDLDLHKEPSSLHNISKDILQKAIYEQKNNINKQIHALDTKSSIERLEISIKDEPMLSSPPPHAIRTARLQGITPNLEWALQWQKENGIEIDSDTTTTLASDQQQRQQQSNESTTTEDNVLPTGFRRSYTFLTSHPEDIRLSDLPVLLDEYRMLVRTTETLLGEKANKASAARKAKTKAKTKSFEQSLLLMASSSAVQTEDDTTFTPKESVAK